MITRSRASLQLPIGEDAHVTSSKGIQNIPTQSAVPVKLIEQYVLTGDRKLLDHIPPVKSGTWSWDGHTLSGALARVSEWTDDDRRLIHVMFARNLLGSLGTWLNTCLRQEKPTDDVLAVVRAELASCQATAKDMNALFPGVTLFARDSKPTSAGRYVLALSDPDLEHAVTKGHFECLNLSMIEFLLEFAPDRIPSLFPVLLKEQSGITNNEAAAALLLRKGGKRFEKEVHAFFESMTDPWHRFHLAQAFFDFDPAKYRNDALEAARASLAGPPDRNNHGPVGQWMVETFGKEVLPDLVEYLRRPNKVTSWKAMIVAAAARSLKQESLPALQAALETNNPGVALATLPYLIGLRDDSQDPLILQTLEFGFHDKLDAVRFIILAAQWKPALVADSLWILLTNKSKPIRDAAARRWEGWATPPSRERASCCWKRKPIPAPRPSPC